MTIERKNLTSLRAHGFKLRMDGIWVHFINARGKTAFQVRVDDLFDASGNRFNHDLD